MQSSLTKHPKELFILALSEMCERFAFWGVGNLIVLYMVQFYGEGTFKAAHTYGIFSGFAAFLPLLGGLVADRTNYGGPLFFGALCNGIGALLLSLGIKTLFYPALLIIVFGFGLFTPTVITLLSYTYKERPSLREAGFSIYYSSINIGVFLAMFTLGYIAKTYSWHLAWLLAAGIQFIGLIPITIYLKKYHHRYKDLHPKKDLSTDIKAPISDGDKKRVLALITLIILSSFFWIGYVQAFASMSIYGLHYIDRFIDSYQMPTAWILSIEPFYLILLAPFMTFIYRFLQKRNCDPSPFMKSAFGLIFASVFFGVMALSALPILQKSLSGNISLLYPLVGYLFLALGEMFLAPISMSTISDLAPKKHKALLTGFWFLSIGVAFYLGGLLAGLMGTILWKNFFLIFVFLTALPAVVLTLISKKLTRICASS